MRQICRQKVCAVFVTWNTPNGFIDHFKATIDQVGHAIIVDNGSGPDTVHMLAILHSRYPDKVKIIYNSINKGIGEAHNQGVEAALESGFNWILLLDHDSRPAPDMVGQLLTAYRILEEQYPELAGKIGLMAPNVREHKLPRDMKLIKPGPTGFWCGFKKNRVVHDVRSVIASGSLIKKEVFQEIGGFEVDFFMDYVDVEFCLRMHQRGWTITAVRDALLHHNLGDIRGGKWMGYDLGVTHHISFRRYTMFRNRVRVWKAYLGSQPGYILFDMMMAGLELVKIWVYESDRKQKVTAALKGAMAGMIK